MTFVNKKKTIVMKSKNSKPSYFIRVCFFVVNSVLSTYGNAQVITDSLANDIRSFAARNISRYRTLNLGNYIQSYSITLVKRCKDLLIVKLNNKITLYNYCFCKQYVSLLSKLRIINL